MKIKRFVLFFTLTFLSTSAIALAIGSYRVGFDVMLNSMISQPKLMLGYIAASVVVGLYSAVAPKKTHNK